MGGRATGDRFSNHGQRKERHEHTLLRCVVIGACLALGGATVRGHEEDGRSRRTYQTSNLVQFMVGTPLPGAATLFRSVNRLDMRVAASGLDPNSAYTVWWIVFNNPAACVFTRLVS